MKASVCFEVTVPIKIFKGENAYVANCPIFDVASQGDSPEDSKQKLIEALTGFLLTCYDMGTLDEVLKESGFVPMSASPHETFAAGDDIIIIPLPFMIADNNATPCHA